MKYLATFNSEFNEIQTLSIFGNDFKSEIVAFEKEPICNHNNPILME